MGEQTMFQMGPKGRMNRRKGAARMLRRLAARLDDPDERAFDQVEQVITAVKGNDSAVVLLLGPASYNGGMLDILGAEHNNTTLAAERETNDPSKAN
ncbi:MAG: hypothetical protein HN396_17645 [Gemmatimonadales bacterium]|nr:hypothetical protein [Gemmatimonadales bacterium]